MPRPAWILSWRAESTCWLLIIFAELWRGELLKALAWNNVPIKNKANQEVVVFKQKKSPMLTWGPNSPTSDDERMDCDFNFQMYTITRKQYGIVTSRNKNGFFVSFCGCWVIRPEACVKSGVQKGVRDGDVGWMCGHLLNLLLYAPHVWRFCFSESWVGI